MAISEVTCDLLLKMGKLRSVDLFLLILRPADELVPRTILRWSHNLSLCSDYPFLDSHSRNPGWLYLKHFFSLTNLAIKEASGIGSGL